MASLAACLFAYSSALHTGLKYFVSSLEEANSFPIVMKQHFPTACLLNIGVKSTLPIKFMHTASPTAGFNAAIHVF